MSNTKKLLAGFLSVIMLTSAIPALATENIQISTTDKSISPIRYLTDDTSMVIASPTDKGWSTTLAASQIKSSWKDTDEFNVVDFTNANITFNDDNTLNMIFNTTDYRNGSLAVLLFENKTQNELSAMQINFSETGVPTFQSKYQMDRVMRHSNMRSSAILTERKEMREITDAKQLYAINNPAPSEILLAKDQGIGFRNFASRSNASDKYSTATSSTQYIVKNSAGSSIKTFTSPFLAIQHIAKNNLSNYYVVQSNDNREIFRYSPNSTDKFYLFQFGNFYGDGNTSETNKEAATEAEAQAWMSYAGYAHSVRCDGIYSNDSDIAKGENQPYAHSYSSGLRTPEPWALEGNTGAYVYKKSLFNVGYKSISSKVLLSQAKLKFDPDITRGTITGTDPSKVTVTNAYIYMSSNSSCSAGNISCDIGLISAPDHDGGWYVISNRKNVSGQSSSVPGMQYFYDDPIVESTWNSTNKYYTPKHDVEMFYSYGNGTVYFQVQNTTTKVAQEGYVDDPLFTTSATSICLMTGTSLVPAVEDSQKRSLAADIKCGAYLKNVIWQNNKIYKQSLWQGTAYSFAGNNSSATNYFLTYDLDNVTSSTSSTQDVINIEYNSSYES